MQSEIWQYYQTNFPGQVQVLGGDVYNGTLANVVSFRTATSATYPLLQKCADQMGTFPSDTNILVPYFERDNYVVIDRQGVIRYHANDFYAYGNRYHRDELRAAINSALTDLTEVPAVADPRLRLAAVPNPFTEATQVEFTHSGSVPVHARVHVLDLAGRRVARLWDGPAPSGTTRLRWEGRADSGATLPPGVYLLRAEIGDERLTRRLVRIP